MQVGLAASPAVSFRTAGSGAGAWQQESDGGAGAFTITVDTTLQYALLNQTLNDLIAGRRITLSEGFFSNYIVVKECMVRCYKDDQLLITCHFAGSFTGTVFLTGKPVYNAFTRTVDMQALAYKLQTKSLLLKGAKWLLAGRIEKEIKKVTSVSLAAYFVKAQTALEKEINKEWTNGITGGGNIRDLQLVRIAALPQHLLLQAMCTGNLHLTVSVNNLNFLG